MSHTAIAKDIKRVGKAQRKASKLLVDELEIVNSLPKNEKIDFLLAG